MNKAHDVITLFGGAKLRCKIINEGVNSYMVQAQNYQCHAVSKAIVQSVERMNASR